MRGASSGDLYVVIHIREHAVFSRDADDLFCEIPVPFVTAALGGEIRVPTLDEVPYAVRMEPNLVVEFYSR